MTSEGKGRLFRRKGGKFLIYLPKDLAEDSMFPFKNWRRGRKTGKFDSIPVKVSFGTGETKRVELIIEEFVEEERHA